MGIRWGIPQGIPWGTPWGTTQGISQEMRQHMQGTVGFATFTTWSFWVCAPRRAPGFTTFTTLTRALVP